MQISELSARTGVSVPSLKYYLREHLLMPGRPVSATRSDYGEEHVARVRLLRAFIDVGGLSIADVRRALDALADPPDSPTVLLSRAHTALPAPGADAEESDEVRTLVERLGWHVHEGSPARRSLSATIDAARAAGVPLPPEVLERYAQAMSEVAAVDLEQAALTRTPSDALHLAVVGTVLVDPVLSALRRLAQEDASRRTLG